MREYKPHPFVCTCASECGGTCSHACHSSARDLPELRIYTRSPLGLVNMAFHFGCVVMRFVEVTCVSTSPSPWFALVPQSAMGLTLTHATPAPVNSQSCETIPDTLRSSQPGIPLGRVVMPFVEVACMSTSHTPWFSQVPQSAWGFSLTHPTSAPVISGSCASIPEVSWV